MDPEEEQESGGMDLAVLNSFLQSGLCASFVRACFSDERKPYD